MKTIIKITVAAVLLAVALTFVFNSDNKSEYITETRETESFNGIIAGGVFNVHLTQGNTESVTIESRNFSPENVITFVKDNNLHLMVNEDKSGNRSKINIYVTFKDIEYIQQNGVATIESDDYLVFSSLNVINNGVGKIKLSGSADNLSVSNEGVGFVNLKNLEAEKVNARNSGVGKVYVNATEELRVNKTGIGRIKYRGDAEITEYFASGIGGIKKKRF